jgi:hypothetical protein
MKKITLSEYLDNDCTRHEYEQQFNPIKLEVNKVYIQGLNTWHEKKYKIIFQDEKISLGICVYNKISMEFIGDYELFNTNTGFKYNDVRIPDYQLIEVQNDQK